MPDLWGCLSNDSGERRWERTRSAFTASQCGGTPVSFDVAVRGGTIVDGTGLPATWPTSACGKGGSSDQGLLEAAVWPVAHVWTGARVRKSPGLEESTGQELRAGPLSGAGHPAGRRPTTSKVPSISGRSAQSEGNG